MEVNKMVCYFQPKNLKKIFTGAAKKFLRAFSGAGAIVPVS
jgi:hypothetical protein